VPSRGTFVPRYLSGALGAGEFAALIENEASHYAGFSLLVGDRDELVYVTNRQAGPRRLAPGIYGLSNHLLDTPWHKVVTTRERLAAAIAARELDSSQLLDLMQDAAPAPDAELTGIGLDPEFARRVSAAFVNDAVYGTRCSSALMVRADGTAVAAERSFDAHGAISGEREFRFIVADDAAQRVAV
jgi:uncharacterized protein with NRDE domain